MRKIPVVRFVFTNDTRLELDLTHWHIDIDNSNDGILQFYDDNDNMFSVVVSNVNCMSTMMRKIVDPFYDPSPRKRLDPR